MEDSFALLSIAVGVAILVTPIVAFIALSRTAKLKRDLFEVQNSQKFLSVQVRRLWDRLQRVQNELEWLKPMAGVEHTEAKVDTEAEMDLPSPPLEATSHRREALSPEQPHAAEEPAVEAQSAEIGEAPDESAEEEAASRPAAAAAKIDSPWEAVTRAHPKPPTGEEPKPEPASDDVLEEIVAGSEEAEPTDEAVPPSILAARVSSVPSADLERRLSTNWLVWVGGVSLAIAGILFVRYIAEQGWLSPALRCSIGVVFGLVLIIAGEAVRRRPLQRAIAAVNPDYVPQALTAAGLVTSFGSVYLAYAFYELIPSGWSSGLLAGITLAALALSLVQGKFVALLGLAGAVATPALVSTEDPSNWGFFTYLGIVALATMAVADRKHWFWLPELSLVAIAGWTALWLQQPFREVDILPIGVTLGFVALAGFALARRAGPNSSPQGDGKAFGLMIGVDKVAGTGFVLALGSACALAMLSDFLYTVHWLLLTFAVVAAILVRLLPRFDWILPALALMSVLVFGLVYVDEDALANLFERLLGTPAPTEYFAEKYQKYLLHGTLIAVALFVGGLQALGRARRPQVVALMTGATPLALLLIGYAQFRNFSGDAVWVWAAGSTLAAAIAATILLGRRKSVAADLPGHYASFAVIAAFLALTFQFDRIWLTLSYSAMVLILAITSRRSDFEAVRKLVNLIVLLVLARLTINPDLRGYEIFHPLGMQWVSYGYLVPLVLFFAAGRIFKRAKDDLTVTVLEGAALLLRNRLHIYRDSDLHDGVDLFGRIPSTGSKFADHRVVDIGPDSGASKPALSPPVQRLGVAYIDRRRSSAVDGAATCPYEPGFHRRIHRRLRPFQHADPFSSRACGPALADRRIAAVRRRKARQPGHGSAPRLCRTFGLCVCHRTGPCLLSRHADPARTRIASRALHHDARLAHTCLCALLRKFAK